jgi:hypothetical protein
LPNGVCVLVTNDDEVEVFKDNTKIKSISGSPLDSSMRLFNKDGEVFFTHEKSVYSVKLK